MSQVTVSPKLVVDGADRALDFYAAVLGAVPRARFTAGAAVVFAELAVGGSTVQLKDADEHDPAPPAGGGGVVLDVVCADPDAVMERALQHGAQVVFAVADQPYGPRQGRFRDPFGHQWIVGTPLTWSDDEVQRGLDGGGAP
jgi:uncharacterized glyoxalase superfamily protein PhnB